MEFTVFSPVRLIDWSIDRLIEGLFGWLIDWLIDWLCNASLFSFHLIYPCFFTEIPAGTFGNENTSSFVALNLTDSDRTDLELRNQFSFRLRTLENNTVLFYLGSYDATNFVQLRIVNGRLLLSVKLSTIVEPIFGPPSTITDGAYHTIGIQRDQTMVEITVDNGQPTYGQLASGSPLKAEVLLLGRSLQSNKSVVKRQTTSQISGKTNCLFSQIRIFFQTKIRTQKSTSAKLRQMTQHDPCAVSSDSFCVNVTSQFLSFSYTSTIQVVRHGAKKHSKNQSKRSFWSKNQSKNSMVKKSVNQLRDLHGEYRRYRKTTQPIRMIYIARTLSANSVCFVLKWPQGIVRKIFMEYVRCKNLSGYR